MAEPVSPLFARALAGQPRVRDFLAHALDGHLGQAYLFLGPAGSGKLEAARALAQGALCPQGGCGVCDDCLRVERGSHPDVHELRPESFQGYLVGQVRDLIDDLQLAPVRAARKVYILDEADRLTESSANALLKNLEEPPESAMFVLLAPTRDAVLPTVLSRCQAVPFRPVPADETAELLAAELGLPVAACRRAVACCASPAQARELLASEGRQQARRAALECLDRLPRADELDIIQLAKAATAAAKAPLADFKEAQQAAFDENAQILPASALHELEDRQKRELTARERAGTMEQLGAIRSLLRDALGQAAASGEEPSCDDYARASAALAGLLDCDGCTRALEAEARAEELVRRNVSPQLALEAMLFEIKELVTCRP